MSKLSRKLILRIALVICAVCALSMVANTFLLPDYFLYQKKLKLGELTSQLAVMDYRELVPQIEHLEAEHQVTIVYASLSDTTEGVNSWLKERLNRKGIALSKFWLTEESIAKLREGGRVNKIYNQSKLKSSYLVNFFPVGSNVFAIGESISHSSDTIGIVNRFNAYLWIGALILLILLCALYAARIVKPLARLNETAEAISNLSFTKADIKTGDEIESLAHSINVMSDKLEDAHRALEVKNANLRTFIADISHELKTPLSLIQVYASGIKDGLDDGTYADVIRKQSEEMAAMIDRLLELSRLQTEPYRYEPIDFRQLLAETLDAYRPAFRQQGLTLEVDDRLQMEAWVSADRRKLETVLHNFMTNAMKYTTGKRVGITVEAQADSVSFRIANGTDIAEEAGWESVWEPFYVMESSRSKKFSGTGLGLSIAKTILQNHQASFGVHVREGIVEFDFSLPLSRRCGQLAENAAREA
ncbi:sensor histidine kinase [Paenibacillus elgii]|uniref:sensor histidine kinase n=1 Tax=Paenibacillus elgii TaxID=189691 RepID=UPI002040CC9A|nr:HAMP domain-containing sensor histidine kinase [Paenibacillus elgii]MCM3272983.1 HAMP domain-containing histidine kinase [Paenibacillus elgii]